MPPHNHFRHQLYLAEVPHGSYEILRPAAQPSVESDEYDERMRRVARDWRRQGVRAVFLVHGTLAGTDALGWIGEIERAIPEVGGTLRRQHKRMVDAFARDQGNYIETFRGLLERYLNTDAETPVGVHLFHWTSQNHHVARAEAAILLIDTLLSASLPLGARVVLWGHSHAGNVIALATNLLGGGALTRNAFFEATRAYEKKLPTSAGRDAWQRVRNVLQSSENPLAHVRLDIATFGTPIRYGWDTLGYHQLIHFVNHRPQLGEAEYRAKFPQSLDELRAVLAGEFGDYFQQTFIAGTNLPPPITNWSAWRTDRILGRLLQRNQRGTDLLKRLRVGRRVADDGVTLLVDYASADSKGSLMVAGHAIYTRLNWLPFHAEQVALRMTGEPT